MRNDLTRPNLAEKAGLILLDARAEGLAFDDAWDRVQHRLFGRTVQANATRTYREWREQWQTALAFAEDSFRAAYENQPDPMIEHYLEFGTFYSEVEANLVSPGQRIELIA